MLELERHKNILKYLYDKREWINGKELANVFDVSDRTIRTDIINIKNIAGNEVILTSKIKGYFFNNEYNIAQFISTDKGLEPSDRLIFIAKKLILYKNGINVYDLADEFFVSDSTIISDICRLKNVISEIGSGTLELKKDGDFVSLSGNDYSRNNLLTRVIKKERNYLQNFELQRYFIDYNIEIIVGIVISNLEKFKFTSKYVSIMELTVNILLILERSKLNVKNFFLKNIDNISFSKEYEIAYSIIKSVEEETGIEINDEEINNFKYVLWCSSELENEEIIINDIIIKDDYMNKFLLNVLLEIKDEYCLDFTLDDEFLKDIATHTKIALKRIIKGICVCNPIKKEMIAEYPFLFDIAIYLARRINESIGILLNEEEISFLVAHIGVAVDKAKNQSIIRKELNVLLIVFEGKATLKHINKKICDIFKDNRLKIYGVSSPYNIEEITNEPINFDIVISTSQFTILNLIQDIVINPQFNIVDEIKTREIFCKKIEKLKKDNFAILFENFFHEETFYRDLKEDTKESVIDVICEDLMKKSYVDKCFRNSVYEREILMSTALESKVALPHPTDVKAIKSGIAIYIGNKSIKWSGRKVKIVFLFAISKDDIKNQRDIYDFIVKIVSKDSNIEEMLKCSNFREFRTLSEKIYLGKDN